MWAWGEEWRQDSNWSGGKNCTITITFTDEERKKISRRLMLLFFGKFCNPFPCTYFKNFAGLVFKVILPSILRSVALLGALVFGWKQSKERTRVGGIFTMEWLLWHNWDEHDLENEWGFDEIWKFIRKWKWFELDVLVLDLCSACWSDGDWGWEALELARMRWGGLSGSSDERGLNWMAGYVALDWLDDWARDVIDCSINELTWLHSLK